MYTIFQTLCFLDRFGQVIMDLYIRNEEIVNLPMLLNSIPPATTSIANGQGGWELESNKFRGPQGSICPL